MFCSRCAGSGKICGNGMIVDDCSTCGGEGSYEPGEVVKTKRIDKKSKAYKEAINEIMAINPNIDRGEAARMFEETYDKV